MNYKFEKPVSGKIGIEKYAVSIQWRNGTLLADEPVKSGGKDLGPDPFTLLLSSLVSCTLATLRMYIDKKGWDIPEISINANLFQITKDDQLTTTIDRDIRFSNSVTQEQRDKLFEIAGNCPVSKLLKGEIAIRTYLYNDDVIEKKINYTNGEVTVVWKPSLCKHSGRCVFGLPKVFDLHQHPWVNMQGADTAAIKAQVDKCPTGALSWFNNQG